MGADAIHSILGVRAVSEAVAEAAPYRLAIAHQDRAHKGTARWPALRAEPDVNRP